MVDLNLIKNIFQQILTLLAGNSKKEVKIKKLLLFKMDVSNISENDISDNDNYV